MMKIIKIKGCPIWLAYCLSIGWRKDQLDALEKLYWKFLPKRIKALKQNNHDRTNNK